MDRDTLPSRARELSQDDVGVALIVFTHLPRNNPLQNRPLPGLTGKNHARD